MGVKKKGNKDKTTKRQTSIVKNKADRGCQSCFWLYKINEKAVYNGLLALFKRTGCLQDNLF